MKYTPKIPPELVKACADAMITGDYMLSVQEEWLQPYDLEEVDESEFNQDFDGATKTKEGLLVGAIRICNTGCEGYHLYVFRGNNAGEIWSDQRVPFGRITKISSSLNEYLTIVRKLRAEHVSHWEQFDQG